MVDDTEYRVLVCGGRAYCNEAMVEKTLDRLRAEKSSSNFVLIQGGAAGADWLARQWARRRHVFCMNYPADWSKHGRAAGPIRNQQMLDEGRPAAVVAFPGGRGTADMIRRAEAAGLPTIQVLG